MNLTKLKQKYHPDKYDMKRLRSDLKKDIGSASGLTAKHLKVPDANLLLGYGFVYGFDELKEYVLEEFSKIEWIKLAKETIKIDGEIKISPIVLSDLKKFGDLMEEVFKKEKCFESVLWETVNPNGTEDRTWVRTFLYLEGYKDYRNMEKTLDKAHVKRIIKKFKATGRY